MMHRRVRAFTGRWSVVAVLLLASTGWADIEIYSTFNPDPFQPSYSDGATWVMNEYPLGFTFSLEGGESYSLANIKLEMALNLFAGDNKLGVSIMTADTEAGGAPGTVLKSFSFDGMLLDEEAAILTGTPVPGGVGGMLQAGETYWLVASIPDNAATGTGVGWYRSSLPLSECSAYMATLWGNPWQIDFPETSGAFRLTAVVPVPGAVLLGVLGLGYSSWRLRRRCA